MQPRLETRRHFLTMFAQSNSLTTRLIALYANTIVYQLIIKQHVFAFDRKLWKRFPEASGGVMPIPYAMSLYSVRLFRPLLHIIRPLRAPTSAHPKLATAQT